jgi:hypothetical protein
MAHRARANPEVEGARRISPTPTFATTSTLSQARESGNTPRGCRVRPRRSRATARPRMATARAPPIWRVVSLRAEPTQGLVLLERAWWVRSSRSTCHLLSCSYGDHLIGHLTEQAPGQPVREVALGGIGGALTVAARLPEQAGATLPDTAKEAFIQGMDTAVPVGAGTAALGAAIAMLLLPGHRRVRRDAEPIGAAPADAPSPAPPPRCSARGRTRTRSKPGASVRPSTCARCSQARRCARRQTRAPSSAHTRSPRAR